MLSLNLTPKEMLPPTPMQAATRALLVSISNLLTPRVYIEVLEAWVILYSQNFSKLKLVNSLKTLFRPSRTTHSKSRPQNVQAGHLNQQHDLALPEQNTHIIALNPANFPICQCDLLSDPLTLRVPRRQQDWEIPLIQSKITENQYYSVCCPGSPGRFTHPFQSTILSSVFSPRIAGLIALIHTCEQQRSLLSFLTDTIDAYWGTSSIFHYSTRPE